MSVVLCRSPGKMILKSFVVALVLGSAWSKAVAGATSYSNVYMQSGPRVLYGPAALRNTQLAPLAAAPLMSNVLPPCVSPCVLPSQQVGALAPVATGSANFVPYKSPIRVPVIVAPSNDAPTSYEYSYVVYDEDTGDQKAQKETSDGSVVRGQYSLIQPDGFIREVQYTADDLRGFNAVVKNFLPEEEAKVLIPCPEVKNEQLKESQEKKDESHDLEPEAHGEAPKKEHGPEGESHEENKSHEEPKVPAEPKTLTEYEVPERRADHPPPEVYKSQVENRKEKQAPVDHVEPESHEKPYNSKNHEAEEKKEAPGRAEQGAILIPGLLSGLAPGGNIETLVSYNDVIKCIQSAIRNANTPQQLASPLTYIVLNKPC